MKENAKVLIRMKIVKSIMVRCDWNGAKNKQDWTFQLKIFMIFSEIFWNYHKNWKGTVKKNAKFHQVISQIQKKNYSLYRNKTQRRTLHDFVWKFIRNQKSTNNLYFFSSIVLYRPFDLGSSIRFQFESSLIVIDRSMNGISV